MHKLFAPAGLCGLLVTLAVSASAAAAVAQTQPLTVSNLYAKHGKPQVLRSGVRYQANKSFPTGLSFRMTEAGWSGAQWRTGRGPGAVGQRKPPFYGWVAFGPGPVSLPPLGGITIMTAYARTPTVAALANSLRTRDHGAQFGPTSSVTVAGYTGTAFDVTIVGHEHAFVPFSRTTGASQFYGDAVYFGKGEQLRIIVLNVNGKSVVIYLENARLPVAQFPSFLTRANTLLQRLVFSR